MPISKIVQTLTRWKLQSKKRFNKYLRTADLSMLRTSTEQKHSINPFNILIPRTQITEKDLERSAKLSDFRWPMFRTAKFDHVLTHYMYSFKNIYSENINAFAMCFVTGPTKCGKSWFLRQNMRRFQNAAINPIVFHYDMQKYKLLSF